MIITMTDSRFRTASDDGLGGRSIISVSSGSTPKAKLGGISAMILAHRICIVVKGISRLNDAHLWKRLKYKYKKEHTG